MPQRASHSKEEPSRPKILRLRVSAQLAEPEIKCHRPRLLLSILMLPCLAACVLRGLTSHNWGQALLWSIIPLGFSFAVWKPLAAGRVDTNHGSFSRREQPVGFWVACGVIFIVYLLTLVALVTAPLLTGH